MNSRRDFLRTVVLGSGSVYLGSMLGCGESGTRKVGEEQQAMRQGLMNHGVNSRSQHFRNAHSYIRDGKEHHRATSQLECDVAIIGAGPSGLCAAYTLSRQGYHVVVVENEAQAGGAAVFSSYRGLRFPLASIYFVDNNPLIQELCAFAGVKPIAAPEDALVLNKHSYFDYWNDAVLNSLALPARDRDAMRKFRDDILAIDEAPAYPLADTLSPEEARLDAMSSREYCSRYNSDFLTKFIDLYTRSSMGGTLDDTNAYCLLNFYTGEIAKTPQTTRLTFDGGLGGFVVHLSSRLDTVQMMFNHCCTSITNTAKSAVVDCISSDAQPLRIKARKVIVASQKFMVPYLIPDLPADQVNAIKSIGYTPMLTVHVCSDKPILEGKGFDTWFPEALDYFTDVIDPGSTGASPASDINVASIYCPFPIATRAMLLDEAKVVQHARASAEKLLELMGNTNYESVSEIYTFAWGHSMVLSKPGSHNGPAQLARRTFKHTHFANTDNDCASAFENAIATGFAAAEAVAKELKAN